MTKVPGGWQYRDGSVWPSLNALKDHLLGLERRQPLPAPAEVQQRLAEGTAA